MSRKHNFWATPHGSRWAVKQEGSNHVASVHPTQSAAWSETRRRARGAGGEALLQGKDGKIRTRNTYGSDPYPPRDSYGVGCQKN